MKRLLALLLASITLFSFHHKLTENAYNKGYEEAKSKYIKMMETEKAFIEEHYKEITKEKDLQIEKLKIDKYASERQKQVNEERAVQVYNDIPSTEFKAWMPHRLLTLKTSTQYKLQQTAITNDRGYRIYDDRYMIAVGSAFGKPGDKLKVKMSTGKEFDAIIGDQKADKDTDVTNRQCIHNGSIIEFIVDDKVFKSTSNKFSEFEGSVIEIRRY